MCGRERLANLTAGAVDFKGGGGGGRPEYAGVELAGILRGLGEEATALALYRYCGHDGLEPYLFYVAMVRTASIAGREGWRQTPGEGILRKLTKCALFEILRPGVCSKCGGVGIRYIAKNAMLRPEQQICSTCNGLGRAGLKAAHVAKAIGRSEHQYHEIWKSRYRMIVDDLGCWLSSLEVQLDRVLKNVS